MGPSDAPCQARHPFHRDAEYEGEPSYHYRLIFRTSGIIEKVYKMRDTIDCHFTPDMLLLRSEKRVNENDYYLIDDIRFSYDRKKILAHSHRYTPTRTKIDTMLVTEDHTCSTCWEQRCICVPWTGTR